MGVMKYVRACWPDLRLHLSVQSSATSHAAVNFYTEHFDIRRAVLPQVLSVRQGAELSEYGPTMNPAFFGLPAEFGDSEIPWEQVCIKLFGLSPPKAKRRVCLQQLPIPAYRAGSQKSPWLISTADLANHIDEKRSVARQFANMK